MLYLDTSFVAPLVIAEDTSNAVEAFVLKLKPGELATSLWTQVELASLVSRMVRTGELSSAEADAVSRELRRVLSESFEMLEPSPADFSAAAKYLEVIKTSLKAGDAVHLAVAANHGCKKILTLDAAVIDAGKRLRLPVSRGIK
jgi:predicted nucleic acid-binding protein